MSDHKQPRMLFYGAMVNLMYCAAQACKASGLPVEYLIEEPDAFPAHHPFWLDVCHQFTEEDAEHFSSSADRFLARVGWSPPDFVRSEQSFDAGAFPRRTALSPIRQYIYDNWYSQERVARLCSAFQGYDAIIVCGSNAVIEAYLSGKPYVIFVYGADLRLYLGADPRPRALRDRISYEMYRSILRDAYDRADAIVSNPPLSIYASGAKNITRSKKEFHHDRTTDIVFPVAEATESCDVDISLPPSKISILIPSRVDFYWKGQDMFLRALSRSPHKNKFHVCLLQWGSNQREASLLVDELQLHDTVKFLPFFATRPLLLALYDRFDLIVDEFYIGTYGTAALEAMSRSKPVVTYIDRKMFPNEDQIPPCLSPHSEDEILRMLEQICNGEINLKELGQAAREWQQRQGSASAFSGNLLSIVRGVLGA